MNRGDIHLLRDHDRRNHQRQLYNCLSIPERNYRATQRRTTASKFQTRNNNHRNPNHNCLRRAERSADVIAVSWMTQSRLPARRPITLGTSVRFESSRAPNRAPLSRNRQPCVRSLLTLSHLKRTHIQAAATAHPRSTPSVSCLRLWERGKKS